MPGNGSGPRIEQIEKGWSDAKGYFGKKIKNKDMKIKVLMREKSTLENKT